MGKNGTTDAKTKGGKQKKRSLPDNKESDDVSKRRRPTRAAACTDFKEKSVRISEKSAIVEAKKQQIVEHEAEAIHITLTESDEPGPRATRRLSDFNLHDSEGASHPVEMMELNNVDIFITGVILPSDECSDKEKAKGLRCQSFGPVTGWSISGYEDGSPVVWISTTQAEYECVKPSSSYRQFYDYFSEKVSASVAVYKKLAKSSGGSPDTSLDELLAAVVRFMSRSKLLSSGAAIQDFVIYQGEFIYKQLIGLDETAKENDTLFAGVPVLVALRDESKLNKAVQMGGKPSNGTLRIGGVSEVAESEALTSDQLVDGADEDDDVKYAKLMQDEEYRKSLKRPRKNSSAPSGSNKFYIKINEDEIANDYPFPAYYKNSQEETDELLLYDTSYEEDTSQLPRRMLHNWALYNSDSRLISLELLPMKPCADIDVTIFGSGLVTEDDGTFGLSLDDSDSSTQGSQTQDPDGMPVFLSQVKEWMIEFGGNMIFISLRTDFAWYRLGKPSKQYAPWYEPVLRTTRVAISIITLLDHQTRASRLSFHDVTKRVSEFKKNDKAYISSDISLVERYVVVHGQIILQLFDEFPNNDIKKSPFITSLGSKMAERHHTQWVIKKKKILVKDLNLNPRAGMAPVVSKRKAMQATTTRLINRIWGDFYSIFSPEDSLQVADAANVEEEVEEEGEIEEDDAEDTVPEPVEGTVPEPVEVQKSHTPTKKIRGSSGKIEIRWDGEVLGKTSAGEPLYRQALVGGEMVTVGGAVILEVDDPDEIPAIYLVEYMFESSDHCKMLHGRFLQRGSETVLGNAANERELFLTNECMSVQLKDIKGTANVEIRSRPWGHQYRKENITADKLDRARAEERKAKDLPTEYYCKSLYSPERGGFFSLPLSDIGRGSGFCNSCRLREDEEERSKLKLNVSKTGFFSNGIEYSIEDYVYVHPDEIDGLMEGNGNLYKAGRNIGLRAFVVCQLLEIIVPKESRKADLGSFEVKVRRFYRPEDISAEKAYASDIQELYYSQDTHVLPVEVLEGKCEVRKKNDMPLCREFPISESIFFCEHFYDSSKGSLKQLPASIKLKFSTIKDDTLLRKKKGKGIEIETDSGIAKPDEVPKETRLATLDIFAGCGGLSQGLEQAGVSETKWAIEYEEPAGQAFRQNHPESTVFVNNCNVILRAIMEKCGDQDDCISTSEAGELAAKLDEGERSTLPLPGQVDFINGGPPCQGFSGMNRFSSSSWSKVQCEMILAFLSFADYFRPRYFLLENVRTFVSFNKGQTFQLTLASLLEMGYQVRFGILEAGAYGVSQSRKRAFIWAAAPEEILPEWPEPMHVFNVPELKISLTRGLHYAAARSTAGGAPFRPITVKDTIGDLPPVENGESKINKEYRGDPVSWFQKGIRGNMIVLTDHICKEMNELNLIRCKKIPKNSPGADWRDLPAEKVKLSNGQTVDLIPWCLPNTADRHNQWKGLFGRLDWQGNFPTSITDPQPMGKVGMCFHPEQDRILTVRECARSQGFADSYEFAGNITHKHKQIGNAVPPPLAFALGRKLKEAVRLKRTSLQHQA